MFKSKLDNDSHDLYRLIFVVFLLTTIGLTVIYTSSSIAAYQKFGDSSFFIKKQLLAVFLGSIFLYTIIKIPFEWIDMLTLPILFTSYLLLSLTLFESTNYSANGASRWLKIGALTFQPAEFSKLAVVLFLSRNLGRSRFNIKKFWSGIFPNIFVVLTTSILLMTQPDFGSTALIFLIMFLMLFVSGLSLKYIYIATALAMTSTTYLILKAPYRLERLISFLNPWAYIQKSGFQIIQSYLGFQNGGMFGVGLGESRQKLYFLPEAHTDFILSVVGEELGFIGVLLVISSFVYISFLGFKITQKQSFLPRKLLAFGLTILITVQACLNMGVCMGMLPTKGMPLPFLSYGPSSILVFFGTIGLLAKINKESHLH